jgi:hypothetical protein
MENIYWSPEMYQIFGLDPSPIPPWYAEITRRLHPEDASYQAIVQRAIRDKTDYDTGYRLILPNGSTKYIHAIGHPVVNASGEVFELVGTAMDVTEQHEARAALETARANKDPKGQASQGEHCFARGYCALFDVRRDCGLLSST